MNVCSEGGSCEHHQSAPGAVWRSPAQPAGFVIGTGADHRHWRQWSGIAEDTTTAVVNVYGGLVLLKTGVRQGQRLKIKNLNNDEETQCVAIDANSGSNQAHEVGVEFVAAAAKFWRVSFPPVDMNSRSPEAKRFGKAGTVQEPLTPAEC
jgi:hypothetical protein